MPTPSRTLATSASFVTAEHAAAALRSCGHAATVELHRTEQGPRWHVVTPAAAAFRVVFVAQAA